VPLPPLEFNLTEFRDKCVKDERKRLELRKKQQEKEKKEKIEKDNELKMLTIIQKQRSLELENPHDCDNCDLDKKCCICKDNSLVPTSTHYCIKCREKIKYLSL
jgi:hypothetical protein